MENYKEYENFCINISKIAGNYVLENFEGKFEIYSKDKRKDHKCEQLIKLLT